MDNKLDWTINTKRFVQERAKSLLPLEESQAFQHLQDHAADVLWSPEFSLLLFCAGSADPNPFNKVIGRPGSVLGLHSESLTEVAERRMPRKLNNESRLRATAPPDKDWDEWCHWKISFLRLSNRATPPRSVDTWSMMLSWPLLPIRPMKYFNVHDTPISSFCSLCSNSGKIISNDQLSCILPYLILNKIKLN